eukprot:PhF_6_TR33630/c0_g1_i1/m.49134
MNDAVSAAVALSKALEEAHALLAYSDETDDSIDTKKFTPSAQAKKYDGDVRDVSQLMEVDVSPIGQGVLLNSPRTLDTTAKRLQAMYASRLRTVEAKAEEWRRYVMTMSSTMESMTRGFEMTMQKQVVEMDELRQKNAEQEQDIVKLMKEHIVAQRLRVQLSELAATHDHEVKLLNAKVDALTGALENASRSLQKQSNVISTFNTEKSHILRRAISNMMISSEKDMRKDSWAAWEMFRSKQAAYKTQAKYSSEIAVMQAEIDWLKQDSMKKSVEVETVRGLMEDQRVLQSAADRHMRHKETVAVCVISKWVRSLHRQTYFHRWQKMCEERKKVDRMIQCEIEEDENIPEPAEPEVLESSEPTTAIANEETNPTGKEDLQTENAGGMEQIKGSIEANAVPPTSLDEDPTVSQSTSSFQENVSFTPHEASMAQQIEDKYLPRVSSLSEDSPEDTKRSGSNEQSGTKGNGSLDSATPTPLLQVNEQQVAAISHNEEFEEDNNKYQCENKHEFLARVLARYRTMEFMRMYFSRWRRESPYRVLKSECETLLAHAQQWYDGLRRAEEEILKLRFGSFGKEDRERLNWLLSSRGGLTHEIHEIYTASKSSTTSMKALNQKLTHLVEAYFCDVEKRHFGVSTFRVPEDAPRLASPRQLLRLLKHSSSRW